MLQRSDLWIKAVCAIVAVVLLFQAGRLALRGSPLANVRIPQLPSLANAPASTNPPSATTDARTNVETKTVGESQERGDPKTSRQGANPTNTGSRTTNVSSVTAVSGVSNAASPSTNGDLGRSPVSTTAVAVAQAPRPPRPGGTAMARAGMGPGGPRGPVTPLPKEIQAKLDRITDSELLAPIMRPMPMALLGIAGEHVFLRAPSGQTGLVKVGDTLGSIKLLKIGINRVLVEEDGEEKELTIFSGMGGESLLASAKATPKPGEETSKSKSETKP